MKRLAAFILLLSGLTVAMFSLAKETDLKTEDQKFAYIIGLEMGSRLGQQFKQQGLDLDMNLVARGILDGSSGAKPKLSKEDMEHTMAAVDKKMQEKQKELMAAQEAKMKEQSAKNDKESKAFLKANAKKDGIKTTKSGLQYKVITAGNGPKPTLTDTVTVNYRGTLIDGTEFDSSYQRGEPATFALNAVIPGWTEALQLMKEGAKWEVYLPADLAYGPGGAGGQIGPNAALIFEVELLKANNTSGD